MEMLNEQKILEEKRRNLALRFDFCIGEFFQQVDARKTGYCNMNDIWTYSRNSGFQMNKEDWCIIMDRFDRDRDGHLNESEFSSVFFPHTIQYKHKMSERSRFAVKSFKDYTIQTMKLIKDLLYSVVKCEENFEVLKFRISNGSVNVSNLLFDWLDEDKDKHIGYDEFDRPLKFYKIVATKGCKRAVYDQFDKSKNGRIEFVEFHTPIKNDVGFE